MNMDQINALFEAFGAVAVLPSIAKAYRSKVIRGVSIITPIFSQVGAFGTFFITHRLNSFGLLLLRCFYRQQIRLGWFRCGCIGKAQHGPY